MTAVKARSKNGHNSTPKGLSIVGRGMAFSRSKGEDDIIKAGVCMCVRAMGDREEDEVVRSGRSNRKTGKASRQRA